MKSNTLIFGGVALIILLMSGCHSKGRALNHPYKRKIKVWHQKRIDRLSREDSWLSLAGLYWLHEGTNSFGADSTNDIIFPSKAPGHIGSFTLQDSTVSVSIKKNVVVTHNHGAIQHMQLQPDVTGHPSILHQGTLSWYIIKRGNKFGVRLKDAKNPALKNFKGIKRFPVQKKWRRKATFIPFDSVRTIDIPSVIGVPQHVKIPGKLTFQIKGKTYSLWPILETSDANQWFIVFGDKTNGHQTYGGGRFLYVNKVKPHETTYIDFNKAYNPPCAFTAFATCPLPPAQNKLPAAIKAGEKKYAKNKNHHH